MTSALLITLLIASLVVFGLGAALAGMGRPPGNTVLIASVALELLVIVQVVWSVVLMIRGDRPAELLVFVLYLVVAFVVMPLVVFWAIAEPTRWSNLVIAIGALTVMGMEARLNQLWQVKGG